MCVEAQKKSILEMKEWKQTNQNFQLFKAKKDMLRVKSKALIEKDLPHQMLS